MRDSRAGESRREIVDANEADPFDLYPAEHNRQLVAERTKNLANRGLRTSLFVAPE